MTCPIRSTILGAVPLLEEEDMSERPEKGRSKDDESQSRAEESPSSEESMEDLEVTDDSEDVAGGVTKAEPTDKALG